MDSMEVEELDTAEWQEASVPHVITDNNVVLHRHNLP